MLFGLQFDIPWTEGNPKLHRVNEFVGVQFDIPWTEGNPKRASTACFCCLQFDIPWTEGNPKLSISRGENMIQFDIPWTEGNPKPTLTAAKPTPQFDIPWTEGNPKQERRNEILGLEFDIPWTEGNPKPIYRRELRTMEFDIPWTEGNPKRNTSVIGIRGILGGLVFGIKASERQSKPDLPRELLHPAGPSLGGSTPNPPICRSANCKIQVLLQNPGNRAAHGAVAVEGRVKAEARGCSISVRRRRLLELTRSFSFC